MLLGDNAAMKRRKQEWYLLLSRGPGVLLVSLVVGTLCVARQAAPSTSGDERQLYDQSIAEPDVEARIRLLQQFLAQYPRSALKEGALEKLVTSYQQAGNGIKVIETNNALLQSNPNNLQAMALVVNVRLRAAAKGMDAQENYKIAGKVAERGIARYSKARSARPLSMSVIMRPLASTCSMRCNSSPMRFKIAIYSA